MIYIVRGLCTASVSGAFVAHTSCTSQIWLFYCTADTPAGTRMFILLHSQAILVLLILSKSAPELQSIQLVWNVHWAVISVNTFSGMVVYIHTGKSLHRGVTVRSADNVNLTNKNLVKQT